MPDLLLDALPVIDLLEITANTRAVAELTQRDQSSVSRIYRQASARLGLAFGKDNRGEYRATANGELLRDLRRSSQKLRLQQLPALRWVGCAWTPALEPSADRDGEALPAALDHRWHGERRTRDLLREHVLDLAVMPGADLLPEVEQPTEPERPVPLCCGQLVALPLVRHPLAIVIPQDHPLRERRTLRPEELPAWRVRPLDAGNAPWRQRRLEALGLRPAEGPEPPGEPTLTLMPALALDSAQARGGRAPLPVLSGLSETDVIVCRSELWREPGLLRLVEAVVRAYRRTFADRRDLEWLR